MKLYHLPTPTDRARIHTLIQANAHGKISRVHMDECITQILFNYRVKHLHMDGYTVHVAEPLETVLGRWPVTHIEAHRWGAGDRCPECGGKGGYLEGGDRYSPWVAGCLRCGTVFKFKEEGRYQNEPLRQPQAPCQQRLCPGRPVSAGEAVEVELEESGG